MEMLTISDYLTGTGKTLTAECVAEYQKRPLYAISCGDLGTDPERLEVKLKEVFNYAVAWKAILLLDEADIFLQERSIDDVNRNALVSIFLRELEYYDGILFVSQAFFLSVAMLVCSFLSSARKKVQENY